MYIQLQKDNYTLKNKSVLDAFKSDLDAFDENEKRLRRFSKK